MDRLKSIFELRNMLYEMEQDIGLEKLSRVERDVLLAAHALTGKPAQPFNPIRSAATGWCGA